MKIKQSCYFTTETLRYGVLRRSKSTVTAILIFLLMGANVQAQQRHSDEADNVLQYVPYASVFALKACGVQSRDSWPQLAVTTLASWVVAGGVGYSLKLSVSEWRPDHSDRMSFPSGHTMFAFAGATTLLKEYGHVSPWIPVAGYGVATFVAFDRVRKDRHHWYDVTAGAALGIASTELTWWLSHKLIKNDNVSLTFTGNQLDVAISW